MMDPASDAPASEPGRPSPTWQLLAVAAATVLWAGIVLIFYYIYHKPIRIPQAKALAQCAADAGAVVLLSIIAGALGSRLMGALRPEGMAEAVAWSTGLGYGIISLIMFGLGTVGGLRPWPVAGLLLLMLALLFRDALSYLRMVWALRRRIWPLQRTGRVWQNYVVFVLLVSLALALLPPTAWDGLVYHLTSAKITIENGRLAHPIDLPYLGFPQLGEMLFTAVMLFRRPAAAQLISLAFGGLLALGTYGLAARRWGRAGGALAAALLFSSTSIVNLLGWPYVDVILMFCATATFAALVRWDAGESDRWLLVAGAFSGMAMGAKYTGLAVLLGGCLVIFVRRKGRGIVRYLACAAPFIAPWLVKNWVFTGNPVYPFLLPGLHWDHWRSWWYSRPGTGLATTEPWYVPLAPWVATTRGVEGGGIFDATIGPLFLALTPAAAVTWRRQDHPQRRLLGLALFFSTPVYLAWLIGISTSALLVQTRLLFPVFPLLAVAAAAGIHGLEQWSSERFELAWVVRGLAVLVLALTALEIGLAAVQHRPFEVIAGFRPRKEYITEQLGWLSLAVEEINALPEGSRTLFLWEPRSFYCTSECWPDALLDRWWHERQVIGDPGQIADNWRALGVSHVLIHESGLDFIRSEGFDPLDAADFVALDHLRSDEMTPIKQLHDAYTLYELD